MENIKFVYDEGGDVLYVRDLSMVKGMVFGKSHDEDHEFIYSIYNEQIIGATIIGAEILGEKWFTHPGRKDLPETVRIAIDEFYQKRHPTIPICL